MPTMGDIIRQHGQAYKDQFQPPPLHLKVLDAIAACRTAALGGHASVCVTCGAMQVWYNSCGNRHCPGCQAFEKEKWVEARRKELLPVPYLHLVFTLPDLLNPLVLSNDKLLYNLLFKAAWLTLRKISQDPKWLDAQMGMVAVLHTWGSNLSLHPHLHCIVPAGGLAKDGKTWKSTKKKHFLAPNKKVIAPIFKAIFMRLLIRAFDAGELKFFGDAKALEDIEELRKLFKKLYQKNWVVYAKKPFGGPEQIVNYLSRYTHRIAISNRRILKVEAAKVTISYKNYRKKNQQGLPKIETLVLSVIEFIRRFMMHVLPKGFQRIRYFGLLAAVNRKTKLLAAQKALNHHPPSIQPLTWQERLFKLTGHDPDVCPFCQTKTLKPIGFIPRQARHSRGPPIPTQIVLFETNAPLHAN